MMPTSVATSKAMSELELVKALLASPALCFDIDGTLIPHHLDKSDIYTPMMRLVVEAASLLSPIVPIIATNKTAAEVSVVNLQVPVITATENCSVISLDSKNYQLQEMLEAILPVGFAKVVDRANSAVKYLLGGELGEIVAETKDLCDSSSHFQKIITTITGHSNFSREWELRAISEAAVDSDLLRNVIEYLGFKNDQEALLSCHREGNSPVFIRNKKSGELIPFKAGGLDEISATDWENLNQEAMARGIFLSRSSKAISVCSLACQEGKGLAIKLSRAMLGRADRATSSIVFAGDAKNDLPAVSELLAKDAFIQLPNTQGLFDPELQNVANQRNCQQYRSRLAAPTALAEIICLAISNLDTPAPDRLCAIKQDLQELIARY